MCRGHSLALPSAASTALGAWRHWGGLGASQEVALVQLGCSSWSCHTLGVHPSFWDGAARAEPGNQMQIWLREDPCITGGKILPSIRDLTSPSLSQCPAAPEPASPVQRGEAELGLEPAQVPEPSTDTLPSKAGFTE